MPGARGARKGKSSLHMGVTTTGIQQASMQINDGNDIDTDKDPDLDMQDIQKPNSMESSMNSASQAP